jgi:hypothetical protein
MEQVLTAIGLLGFGWVCLIVAIFPRPTAPDGRPWLSWILGAFALVFFLLSSAVAFGWIHLS